MTRSISFPNSWTRLVSSSALPDRGFLKQEEIDLDQFLQTKNGRLYSGQPHGGKFGATDGAAIVPR